MAGRKGRRGVGEERREGARKRWVSPALAFDVEERNPRDPGLPLLPFLGESWKPQSPAPSSRLHPTRTSPAPKASRGFLLGGRSAAGIHRLQAEAHGSLILLRLSISVETSPPTQSPKLETQRFPRIPFSLSYPKWLQNPARFPFLCPS